MLYTFGMTDMDSRTAADLVVENIARLVAKAQEALEQAEALTVALGDPRAAGIESRLGNAVNQVNAIGYVIDVNLRGINDTDGEGA